MARKTLSSQIIDETDRARGILASVQDSSDDILGILIGTAIESLNRIEGLCLRSMQNVANAVLENRSVDDVPTPQKGATAVRSRSGSHKAAPRRKAGA